MHVMGGGGRGRERDRHIETRRETERERRRKREVLGESERESAYNTGPADKLFIRTISYSSLAQEVIKLLGYFYCVCVLDERGSVVGG